MRNEVKSDLSLLVSKPSPICIDYPENGSNGNVSHPANGVCHNTKACNNKQALYQHRPCQNICHTAKFAGDEGSKVSDNMKKRVKNKLVQIIQSKAAKLNVHCESTCREKNHVLLSKVKRESNNGINLSMGNGNTSSALSTSVKDCQCNIQAKALGNLSRIEHSENISNNLTDDNFVHNRKHVKLKQIDEENANTMTACEHADKSDIRDPNSKYPIGSKFYILESVRRLSIIKFFIDKRFTATDQDITNLLLVDVNAPIEIKHTSNTLQLKKMRSFPKFRIHSSVSSEETCLTDTDCYFKCEWYDCKGKFSTVENVTKHVKKDHVHPAAKNDVFVCLWRNCRFSNQPSCSYKWLLKHVLRHCDMKPFKCVIFGCDMAFVTQNGLARHVPTHFNEGKVRRTCVMTNTSEASQHWESPKVKKSLAAKLNSCTNITETKENVTMEDDAKSKLRKFVEKHKKKGIAKHKVNQKVYNQVKQKLEKASCSPLRNHGYVGQSLRIEHKVIGRRTSIQGDCDMLLSPSLDRIIQHKSFWFDATAFRKRKSTSVDIAVTQLENDTKNNLYDIEHASKRRKRKRK